MQVEVHANGDRLVSTISVAVSQQRRGDRLWCCLKRAVHRTVKGVFGAHALLQLLFAVVWSCSHLNVARIKNKKKKKKIYIYIPCLRSHLFLVFARN